MNKSQDPGSSMRIPFNLDMSSSLKPLDSSVKYDRMPTVIARRWEAQT